jgi:hypothetical protein
LQHPVLVRTPEGAEVWRFLNCLQEDDVLVLRSGVQAEKASPIPITEKQYQDSYLQGQHWSPLGAGLVTDLPPACFEGPVSLQYAFLKGLASASSGSTSTLKFSHLSEAVAFQVWLMNLGVVGQRKGTVVSWFPGAPTCAQATSFQDTVLSIDYGRCRMFDLTVPGSHTFLGNFVGSHNCQGLTLDSVRLDASNCFEAGQLYVALSRVRKLEHLTLIDFREKSLLSDPRAVAFESLPDFAATSAGAPQQAPQQAGSPEVSTPACDDSLSSCNDQPPPSKKRRVDE